MTRETPTRSRLIPPGPEPLRRPPLSPPAGAVARPQPVDLVPASTDPRCRSRSQGVREQAWSVPARPLVVTADPDLLADLLRLSAAIGVWPEVVPDLPAASPFWREASYVVVGADVAAGLLEAGLPHRPDVVVAARGGQPHPAGHLGHRVRLPDDETWLVDLLSAPTAPSAPAPGARAVCIGVLGGRGGAGATTLSAALATVSAAVRRTMVVDLDPVGGGLDLVLGVEDVPGLRWSGLAAATGQISPAALAESLPHRGGLGVLSWDRAASPTGPAVSAVQAVLDAGRRAHELVVLDLPRAADPVPTVLSGCDLVLLVVPAEVRAVAAAGRLASVVAPHVAALEVVARGPAPSGLTGDEIAELLGLPLAGWLRAEPRLDRVLERGEPPGRSARGPLAQLCGQLLDRVVPDASRRAA